MSRRLTALLALALATGLAVAPADAAVKKKPKPKDIKGSYTLNLMPDPTGEVTGNVKDGCSGLLASGRDNHPFTVPAAGKLYVHLVSVDPTGHGVTDWDLWLVHSDGHFIDQSHDATSDEETTTIFKKKTPITIQVCNLLGQQAATVTYVFKYA
ncbi:MAG: hypothetical protein JWM40_2656 [Frankiales bacterium]|nr:hypothetical protein [Frankiales bacterium]